MVMLNTSPNIKKFAARHSVEKQSVIDTMTFAFGNHVDILKHSEASFRNDGTLQLSQGTNGVILNIIDVDLHSAEAVQTLKSLYVLGTLTRLDSNPNIISVLITI